MGEIAWIEWGKEGGTVAEDKAAYGGEEGACYDVFGVEEGCGETVGFSVFGEQGVTDGI